MSLKEFYVGWQSKSHLTVFDFWNKLGPKEFTFRWGCFQEQVYLSDSLSKGSTLLEVGCASGTTVRFLKETNLIDNVLYKGVDLGEEVVKKAKKIHKGFDFQLVDTSFTRECKERFDIVFSRDTLMHQTNPLQFLEELSGLTKKVLIMRIRTRDSDIGDYNPDTSCQVHYDKFWMPYIVMPVKDLIECLCKNPRVKEIHINKNYQVLGGNNGRFLPKELYLSEAGGSETAIKVIYSDNKTSQPPHIIFTQLIEGQSLIRHKKFNHLFFRICRKIGLKF